MIVPAVGLVRGLHNTSFIESILNLLPHLRPVRPAAAQFDSLLDLGVAMPPAAPPPGVGGDGNYTGLALAPYKALSSSCSWMDASIVGTPLDITLPLERLYELYEQVICVPLLYADMSLHMLSLQIGPYTANELQISFAKCTRHLPPPLAPPPTAPPELRPTHLVDFDLDFSGGLVDAADDAQTGAIVEAVRATFADRLDGVAPPGFNATVTVVMVQRIAFNVLLAARIYYPPISPFAWLERAVVAALPGCAHVQDRMPSLCTVTANDLHLLSDRTRRTLQTNPDAANSAASNDATANGTSLNGNGTSANDTIIASPSPPPAPPPPAPIRELLSALVADVPLRFVTSNPLESGDVVHADGLALATSIEGYANSSDPPTLRPTLAPPCRLEHAPGPGPPPAPPLSPP